MGEFFHAASDTALGEAIRNSRIGFPVVETTHLIGLALLLGSILIVNGRFLGLGLRRQKPAEVFADITPWTLVALGVMIASGVLLFLAKAGDVWDEDRFAFELKMSLIAAGIVYHFTVTRGMARSNRTGVVGALAAVLAIAIWFTAAASGLSIEFL